MGVGGTEGGVCVFLDRLQILGVIPPFLGTFSVFDKNGDENSIDSAFLLNNEIRMTVLVSLRSSNYYEVEM